MQTSSTATGPVTVGFVRGGTAVYTNNYTINTNETPNGVTVTPSSVIFPAGVFSSLLIGPAMISGRISSLAVDPHNPGVMYVAAASGGVWKTENGGATWTRTFPHFSQCAVSHSVNAQRTCAGFQNGDMER